MNERVRYRFAGAEFCPASCHLRIDGQDVVLEQKVADLLQAFCRRPRQVLTKSWLLEEIWPGRVVNEDSLSVAVSKLRRALGDRAAAPRYIRTVTGTGYLWLPAVKREPTVGPRERPGPRASWRRSLQPAGAVGVVVAAVALGVAIWWAAPDGRLHDAGPPATGELGELGARAAQRLDSEDPAELRRAIADFRLILERRPGEVSAYLGIAEAKMQLSAATGHLDIELYRDEVLALLEHVLDMDPDNARAWIRLAELRFLADWDMVGAEMAFREAIRAEPDNPEHYLPYTELLLTLGEFERAEAVLVRLREADPAWYRFINMSFLYLMRGELERALDETRRLATSEAESESTHKILHRVALLLGDDPLAFRQLRIIMRAEGVDAARIQRYEALYREQGLQRLFDELLDDRFETNVGHYRPPMAWARYAVTAGREQEALDWLERAFEERQPQVLLIAVDPHYDPLRELPGFKALLDRLPWQVDDPGSA
ncbi:hypothetical protein HFP89_10405 [Wenzhouxiangella sp. XN79A]|uniref:winged helix-turn-helix domain-containing protein n=1 Tax=Wenzhouxiangella sp. XN79A TaxID=2724193 RepID=UPI00144AA287|nr:winged helix-turn-helix domain-containing protein [Wenzhouxiangella sp. XN79A]NKI35576.1 hypothetical protein [Wenzhouxiangella sp. XN79A]